MAVSRTRNVALNMTASLLTQALMLVLNFVSRTVFIKTLGIDYLGVNGLFHNVLSVLSFAELGIGQALVFSMYKPLAIHDDERLCSLMQLYKKVYNVIFIVVLGLGLAIMPFLDFVIKGEPNISENLKVIYLLYLFNTSISYLYIYKQSIITADQKGYIVTSILTIANIVKVAVQIAILYIFKDFILYLIIQVLCTVAGNLYCSYKADKMYPFIKNKPKPLEKSDSKRIFTDVKSMAAYKFGSIILNSTDNIIISAMVNITTVGLVSNYTMLSGACNSILRPITRSFTASIGNLNAVGTIEQKYNVFNKILLITAWIYGMASIGLVVLSKYFIEVWLGSEYVMSQWVIIALISEFYISGIHTLESHYRTTMGFFVKGRLAPLLAAILNVGLSILFGYYWGVMGIFVATTIARVLSLTIIDSHIIYRDGFNKSPWIYFAKNIGFLFLFIFIGLLSSWLVSHLDWHTWFGVLIQILIVVIVYNGIMILVFHKTQGYKEIVAAGKAIIKRKKIT